MGHYNFGYSPHERIGAQINTEYNLDISRRIRSKNLLRRTDVVTMIRVHGVDDDMVTLEVWAKNCIDIVFHKKRYNVFYVTMPPKSDWVCVDYE
jgi:hypothetical protein